MFSIASGLVVGYLVTLVDIKNAEARLDSLTSPAISLLRARDCTTMADPLQSECQRIKLRYLDPIIVAAADALDQEQAYMRIAVRAAGLPGPMRTSNYILNGVQPPKRNLLPLKIEENILELHDNTDAGGQESEPQRLNSTIVLLPTSQGR